MATMTHAVTRASVSSLEEMQKSMESIDMLKELNLRIYQLEKASKYRNALMWAYDRLTVDNPTKKEMSATILEIGKVLSEQPSVATHYAPNEWDQSARARSGKKEG